MRRDKVKILVQLILTFIQIITIRRMTSLFTRRMQTYHCSWKLCRVKRSLASRRNDFSKEQRLGKRERRREGASTRQEKWMDGRSQFGPPITTTQSSQFIIPCPPPQHPLHWVLLSTCLHLCVSLYFLRSWVVFFVRFTSSSKRRGAQWWHS